MTVTTSSSISFRTPAPGQFHQTPGSPWSTGDNRPASADQAGTRTQDRFGEKFRSAGVDVSREECHELAIFEDFLDLHVQANRICDVQCMLLWSEWIRAFRRRSSGFPDIIREKEFRSVITKKFGTEIANDGFRGAVYPGIKFVP
jgi:hypothetical protein